MTKLESTIKQAHDLSYSRGRLAGLLEASEIVKAGYINGDGMPSRETLAINGARLDIAAQIFKAAMNIDTKL